jgi:flavin reductase (DIM6/NTAB) family NADH-FMN oxidoreductase RutF
LLVDARQLAHAAPVSTVSLTDVDEEVKRSQWTTAVFRQGVQHLVGGVTVVTSGDDDGNWYGVTTTSVCALSADPPTLIACVQRQSRIGEHLGRTGRFCVNLLSGKHQAVAEAFAGRRALGTDGFRRGQWVSGTTGSPVLRDGLASFECGVDLMYGYPTHIVVIGMVKQVRHAAVPASPLVRVGGQFGHVIHATSAEYQPRTG